MIRSAFKYLLFFAGIFLSLNLTNAQFENYNPIVSTPPKYQTQGFTNFQESFGKVDFVCNGQCVVLVGPITNNDYIYLNGSLAGNGILGYGFLVGQQVYPGENLQINGGGTIDHKFMIANFPMYSQIPKEAQVVLIMQGNLTGYQMGINGGTMGLFEKIGQGWSDFWKHEPYGYYSINLLYGPKILGESATKMFSIWLVIATALMYLYMRYKKRQKFKINFIYLSAIFFVIFGLRYIIIDEYNIVKTDYKTFISQPDEKKIFRNYNDIYAFVQFIKSNVDSGSKINFISYQVWPYPGFSEYQLRPFIKFDTGSNIVVVYDVGTMKLESGNLINIKDGKMLFTGLYDIKYFNNFSFIAKK